MENEGMHITKEVKSHLSLFKTLTDSQQENHLRGGVLT